VISGSSSVIGVRTLGSGILPQSWAASAADAANPVKVVVFVKVVYFVILNKVKDLNLMKIQDSSLRSA
jgi:hypothetical protein